MSSLLSAKGATRVSVVLPALNEAATVGRIVQRIRPLPLVDELVVMDSGSTDATIDVARAAGATVFRREDVLSHLPPYDGKGEVLWRSLAATSGDIVVFVDSDLRDFSPSFVTGRPTDGRDLFLSTAFLLDEEGVIRWVHRPDTYRVRAPARDGLRAIDALA